MADDACSTVKSDLEAGTWTNYGSTPPIIITDQHPKKPKNKYIELFNSTREPIQTVSGSLLYTKRSCQIRIVMNTTTNRDNVYDDIFNILTATCRGYTITRGKDIPDNKKRLTTTIIVSMSL